MYFPVSRLPHDGSHHGHVLIAQAAPEREGHELFGDGLDELVRPLEQGFTELRRAIHLVPFASLPLESIAVPASRSLARQAPTTSKFSSAKPSGSMTPWQPLQDGFERWSSSRSRTV